METSPCSPPPLQPQPRPFASQAAHASWGAAVWIFFVVAMAGQVVSPLMLDAVVGLLIVLGLLSGIVGLLSIPKHGIKGLLIPSLVGLLLNGFLGFIATTHFIQAREAALPDRQADQESFSQAAGELEEAKETFRSDSADIEDPNEASERLANAVMWGADWKDASIIVVHFHGRGDDAESQGFLGDWFELSEQDSLIAPSAPHELPDEGYSWFANTDADFEAAKLRALSTLRVLREGNPNARIYVGGFSQGGMISAGLLEYEQLSVDGIYVWSGWAPLPEKNLERSRQPPVLVAHGSQDPIMPIAPMRMWVKELRKQGLTLQFLEEDHGHDVSEQVLEDTRDLIKGEGRWAMLEKTALRPARARPAEL